MCFNPKVRRAHFASALFAAVALSVIAAPAAHAAAPLTNCTNAGGALSNGSTTCTFTVNNANDEGSGSLRQAILDANAWGNYANRVAGNSVINVTATGTVQTSRMFPMVASNVTLNGNGLTIEALFSNQRCFFISGLPIEGSGPTANPNDGIPQAIAVTLSNLVLNKCKATGGSGFAGGLGAGAAVFVNQGVTLTLDRVTMSNSVTNGGPAVISTSLGGGMGGLALSGAGGMGGVGKDSLGVTVAGGGIGSYGAGAGGGGFGVIPFSGGANTTMRGVGEISSLQGFPQAACSGGANGGGGGAGGDSGHATGRGGAGCGGGIKAAGQIDGIGGVGGGGDGTTVAVHSGGFGGAGGGAPSGGAVAVGRGAPGGFGGAGGPNGPGGFGAASSNNNDSSKATAIGGFGAGGGSGASGGFAAGTTGGSGGAALGGALFIVDGASVTIIGSSAMSGGSVSGTGTVGNANRSFGLGSGAFMQGNGTLTLNQAASETLTLSDAIADQTGSWPAVGITIASFYATGGPSRATPANAVSGQHWSYSNGGRWSLVKNGAGDLVLSGVNTFSGAASAINAGTLRAISTQALGFGSWSNAATLQIVSPRTLTLGSTATGMPQSNYTQTSAATLKLGITGAGCVADTLSLLRTDSTATLGGVLVVAVSGGCVPAPGSTYTVISTANPAGLSGTFSSVQLSGVASNTTLSATYSANSVVLTATVLVQCTAGNFSASGYAPCTPAPKGSFVDSIGATSATTCPANTTTLGTGATSAVACNLSPNSVPLGNCTDTGGVLSNGNATCTFTVTTSGDSVDISNPAEYVALAGSLRRAILDANAWGNYANMVAGNSVIDATALGGQTIALGSDLPLVFSNLSLLGPSSPLTISGGGLNRCFFVSGLPTANQTLGGNDGVPQAIRVSVSNLVLNRCTARGGSGSGSGMGAGGALFVNQQATVTLSNVSFQSSAAVSGAAGSIGSIGGGGMGSNGASPGAIPPGGGGGGMALPVDASYVTSAGSGIGGSGYEGCESDCGGGGFGGNGLGQVSPRQAFATAANGGGTNGGGGGLIGQSGHASGTGGVTAAGGGIGGGGQTGVGGIGGGGGSAPAYDTGRGGFGGGGGGGGGTLPGAGGFGGGGGGSGGGIRAGAGGFGGGGGSAPDVVTGGIDGGGDGGYGGGGGGRGNGTSRGLGGFAGGSASNSVGSSAGGTGAALGGAVFVVQGATLLFDSASQIGGGSVSANLPNNATAGQGAALGSGIFLQGNGTLTFAPTGGQQSITDAVADQTGSWPALGITTDATYAAGGPFNGADWSYTKSGRWNIVKNGAGTLRLDGANTYSGAASVVNAGELFLNGDSALGFGSWTNNALMRLQRPTNGGVPRIFALGSGATGMPNANFTQSATGVLRQHVYDVDCANNSRLQIKNVATLGGVLEFEFRDFCVPAAGRTITVLTAGSVTGAFATIRARSGANYTQLPAGLVLVPAYTATVVTVRITAQCAPGTYSGTGFPTCTAASAGNFAAGFGATSQTACSPGSFQPLTGQSACLSADVGSFVSGSAAIAQVSCVAGTYQPNPGQLSCLDAMPGNYVRAPGANMQIQCVAGTYSSAVRATSCTPASVAFYVPTAGASSQTPCPLGSTSSAGATVCTRLPLLNIDDSDAPDVYSANTDGTLLLRYLLGLRGTALTAGALGTNARRDAAQIATHIETYRTLFDVDGDGETRALTDGVMILRRLLGLSGSALTNGVKNSARSDDAVRDAIDALKP